MSRPSREEVERFFVERRLRTVRARQAAQEVHEHLQTCLNEGEFPELDSAQIRRARRSDPVGDFPTHSVLLLAFEDLL